MFCLEQKLWLESFTFWLISKISCILDNLAIFTRITIAIMSSLCIQSFSLEEKLFLVHLQLKIMPQPFYTIMEWFIFKIDRSFIGYPRFSFPHVDPNVDISFETFNLRVEDFMQSLPSFVVYLVVISSLMSWRQGSFRLAWHLEKVHLKGVCWCVWGEVRRWQVNSLANVLPVQTKDRRKLCMVLAVVAIFLGLIGAKTWGGF